jgi:hypothetical protein
MYTATFKIQTITEEDGVLYINPHQWTKALRCTKERGKGICEGMAISAWIAGQDITYWEKVPDNKHHRYPDVPKIPH